MAISDLLDCLVKNPGAEILMSPDLWREFKGLLSSMGVEMRGNHEAVVVKGQTFRQSLLLEPKTIVAIKSQVDYKGDVGI